jgi:bifunctional UDP-N-acetylglucosamine pyrophosphorylase/glucosamine-1-phosphate N-acetyltransferase
MKSPLFVMLAGGEGKRFAPLVTNKTIFPFLGKPLLVHQLEQLARVGAEKVLVASNTVNQVGLKNIDIKGLTITAINQKSPLGMADALLALEKAISNQPIIVMNSVDVVDDSLFADLLSQIKTNPDGLITGIKVNDYFPGGYLKLNGKRVTQVIEKPAPGTQPSQFVNLVFHYHQNPEELFNLLGDKNTSGDDAYEQVLSRLMKVKTYQVVEYDSYWHKLKYPHFVLGVMELFLNHKLENYCHPSAKISENAVLERKIYVDEGAKIEAGAVIKGPAYIGKNVIIGNHVLVRQSDIEENSIIGAGSEIARSYIGPNCSLHHNFIGDSVLEADINPGYGTATTNLRLDKRPIKLKLPEEEIETTRTKLGAILAKGVNCGAQTLFMPGVTVGANSLVYPMSTVNKGLPENSKFKQ